MTNNNRANAIDQLAEKDHYTNDTQYNAGLKLLRENGYLYICGHPSFFYIHTHTKSSAIK